jgi:hypothetical protein
MTITLTLAPELEFKLKQEADRRGLPPEQYALEVLDKNIADADEPVTDDARERAEKLAELFRQWNEEEVDESEALDDEFFKMLDEDRPSYRKLFPPELKGITW